MRVVLDTNIIVSAHINPHGEHAQILEAWKEGGFDLLVSEAILEEYQALLQRPRISIRHQLTAEQINEIIATLREFATLVAPTETLTVVTDDPDDNKFIECAVAGEAAYIVSRDPDLLHIQEYRGIQMLSPAAFLAVLTEEAIERQ